MDYGLFVKKLEFPSGFVRPTDRRCEGVVAIAITGSHLADAVAGLNAGIDLIHQTRGRRWSTEPVTEDYNFGDLARQ